MDRGVSAGDGMERGGENEKNLNQSRLAEFYRIYNPEKVDSADKVFKLFDGRTEVLNEKLKRKVRRDFYHPSSFYGPPHTRIFYFDGKQYGKGFLPNE